MTLLRKIYLYVSIALFFMLLTFFILVMFNAKNNINSEEISDIKVDIKQFESIIQSGNMVNVAVDSIFKNKSIKSIKVNDFLDKEIYHITNNTNDISGFAILLFGVTNDVMKVYSKDAGGENLTILVEANDGYINNIIQTYFYQYLIIFFILFLVAEVILFLIIKSMLKPLEPIKNQIFHLKDNKFIENHEYPKTTDLREITVMLNEAVSHLRAKFKKDTELLTKYYEVIYNDEETGLNNRTSFTMHLNSEIDSSEDGKVGIVIFVKIVNFDLINKTHGYQQISNALSNFTKALEKLTMPYALLARIKPDTFAYIVTENFIGDKDKTLSEHYDKALESINKGLLGEKAEIAISSGEFKKGDSVKSLLSRVDTALNEATMITKRKKIAHAKHGQRALSKEERVNLMEYAFKNDAFSVELRPLQDLKEDRKNFLKLIVFLKDEKDNIYNKDEFLSILHEKGLMGAFDENILNKITNKYRRINQPIVVMVNITSDFINSLDHIRWLGDRLEEISSNENLKICFSINDDIALNEFEKVLQFAKLVYRFKHHVAISGFTLDQEKQSYLERLRPSYIVIDQDYIENLYFEDKSRIKAIKFMITEVRAQLVVAYLSDPSVLTQMEELDADYLLGINYKGEY